MFEGSVEWRARRVRTGEPIPTMESDAEVARRSRQRGGSPSRPQSPRTGREARAGGDPSCAPRAPSTRLSPLPRRALAEYRQLPLRQPRAALEGSRGYRPQGRHRRAERGSARLPTGNVGECDGARATPLADVPQARRGSRRAFCRAGARARSTCRLPPRLRRNHMPMWPTPERDARSARALQPPIPWPIRRHICRPARATPVAAPHARLRRRRVSVSQAAPPRSSRLASRTCPAASARERRTLEVARTDRYLRPTSRHCLPPCASRSLQAGSAGRDERPDSRRCPRSTAGSTRQCTKGYRGCRARHPARRRALLGR